jgi:hypothetical protein
VTRKSASPDSIASRTARGRGAAQDSDRETRSDAGHGDQPLEEVALHLVGEAEELERVLAHVEMAEECDLAAHGGQRL